jgi:hypothetical protein
MLALLSVGWLIGKWDYDTALYSLLFFSSYPLIIALQVRQPTILFLAIALAAFALLRHGRFLLAGVIAALSTGKPQVALPIILAMLVWSCAQWRIRKEFAFSFVGSLAGCICISTILVPGWISAWIHTLRAYSHYGGPLITRIYFGSTLGYVVSALLFVTLVLVLWKCRASDLLFQMALSVVVCQLFLPSFVYSAVILVIPAIWVVENMATIAGRGWPHQLVLTLVRVAFFEFWLAVVAGAFLVHTNTIGKIVVWWIGQRAIMVGPLLASLIAIMVMQAPAVWSEARR